MLAVCTTVPFAVLVAHRQRLPLEATSPKLHRGSKSLSSFCRKSYDSKVATRIEKAVLPFLCLEFPSLFQGVAPGLQEVGNGARLSNQK